jgi:hypothetical protein
VFIAVAGSSNLDHFTSSFSLSLLQLVNSLDVSACVGSSQIFNLPVRLLRELLEDIASFGLGFCV